MLCCEYHRLFSTLNHNYVSCDIYVFIHAQVCGICGNYDGDKDNDLVTREGVDVSHMEKYEASAAVGGSWIDLEASSTDTS